MYDAIETGAPQSPPPLDPEAPPRPSDLAQAERLIGYLWRQYVRDRRDVERAATVAALSLAANVGLAAAVLFSLI